MHVISVYYMNMYTMSFDSTHKRTDKHNAHTDPIVYTHTHMHKQKHTLITKLNAESVITRC